jgi:hypothetical protein
MYRYIPRLGLGIVVALACSCTTVARAQTSNWNVGSGNWNTPGNWDPTGVPGAGDTVDIINFDGVPRTITYNYTGPAVTLGDITIDLYGSTSGGANTLSMSSNSLTSAGTMYVGYYGNGEVDQSGGTVTLTDPVNSHLYVGNQTGSSGTYNLSGSGVLNCAGLEQIGNILGATSIGIFNQTGGTNTCNGLELGTVDSSGTGTYNLHAGALQGEEIDVYTGGVFNQFGGNITIPGSHGLTVLGTYNLSNGNLTGTGPLSGEFIYDGNFVQSGGTNSFALLLVQNTSVTEPANFTLSAGSLTVNSPAGDTAETLTGVATFTQTGGTNTIGGTGGLFIGYNDSAYGESGTTSTYALSGTGVLTVNSGSEYIGYGNGDIGAFNQSGGTHTLAAGNYLYLGFNSGAQGTYTLSDGSLSVTGHEFIGDNGTGTFTQTGGTNTIAAGYYLIVASNGLSSGTYNLGGDGVLQTNLDEVVGDAGSGAFNQTGGTNTINGGYHLDIAYFSGSTGDYTLSGGTANVSGNVYVGGFSGGAGGIGTLNVSDSGVLNVGGTLEVYNKAGNSLNLSGGTINTPALNFNGNPALLNWTGGTLNLTTDVTFDSAAAPTSTSAAFGSALTLGTNQTLMVTGNETLGGVGPFALTLNPGSVHTVTSGLFLDDNGTLNLYGGTLNNFAFYQYGGTLNGTLTIPQGGGYLYVSGIFNGQLVNQGNVDFAADFTAGNGMVNSGFILPLEGQTLTFNGAGLTNSSTIQGISTNIIAASLTNSGQLSLIDSTLQALGNSNNSATGVIEMIGGTLTGGPDSDHLLVNHGRINLIDGTVDGYLNCAADGVLNTAGSTTFNGNVTSSGQTFVGALDNTGVFQQIGGTLTGYGNFTNSGTAIFAGTQSWSPGTTFTNTAGSATFQSDAGSAANSPLTVAVNGGVVTFVVPQHLAALSIADPSGTLGFDLASPTSFGKAIVNGLLTAGGTLQVSLTNNFTPVAGNSFDLLDWGSLSGTFSSADLPDMNGRIVWDSSQLYTTGTISVVATYYAGDFNRDGHVDAADILAMEQALADLPDYEVTKGLTDAQLLLIGDINGDGVVNNADLQALEDYLIAGNGSADSVPEPASWILAFMALAMVSGTRFCVRCVK